MTKIPNVTVLATGGTIAGSAESPTSLTSYKVGTLSAKQLIEAVPSISELANICTEQIANVPSENFTFELLLKLAKRVNTLLQDDTCHGIVVTHGTDTLEETAYFLNLVVKSEKPVVIVGSMRPATAIGSDGPLNLLDAVGVAATKESYGKGVLIVLDGHIVAAREGTKSNTLSTETFKAHEVGILGYVIGFKAIYYRDVIRLHTRKTEFDIMQVTSLPRVDIVYEYLDASTAMHEAIIASKPDGIIIAATGNGCISDKAALLFGIASKQKIVVVRSSRTGSGVITPIPEDMDNGFIASDNLNPQKARILLTLALLTTKDPQKIRAMFAKY